MSNFRTMADAHGRPWLAALDPRLKLAWVVGLSVMSVLVDSTPALIVLGIVGTAPIVGLKMSIRGWALVGGLVLLTAWGTLLSQAIFYPFEPRTVIATIVPPFEIGGWELSGIQLFREGAVYGLSQSLRMIATTVSGLAVCLSTSPQRLLAALVRVRVPTSLAFMTVTALRFLPTMLDEWAAVRQARRLRGYRFRVWGAPGRRWRSWQAEIGVLMPLLAAGLRRTTSLAISVTCRGFQPSAPRTFYPPLCMVPGEQCAIVAIGAICLGVAVAKWLLWASQGEWYHAPALEGLYAFAREWL